MTPSLMLPPFEYQRRYAHDLVRDVADEDFCLQPEVEMNHPAWVLGHLAVSCDWTLKMLGHPTLCEASWASTFDGGAKPTPVRSDYPGKAQILAAYDAGHESLAAAVDALSDSRMSEPSPYEPMRESLPTLGAILVFALNTHEGIHLGQLSAWRRAAGLPPV